MSQAIIRTSLLALYKTRDFMSFQSRSLKQEQDIEDLIDISLDLRENHLTIIGSWVCAHIVEENIGAFLRRQNEIVSFLEEGKHQSTLRSWMKVLTFLNVNENLHGRVIDLCTKNIANSDNKVALQVYSIQALTPLVHTYPELLDEIDSLIELHSTNKSVAYGTASQKFKNKTKNYVSQTL